MKQEFICYEQALQLKELGFNEPCFAFYDESLYFPNNENQYGTFCSQKLDVSTCSAPTFSQAFRWFREKYPNLDFGVGKVHNGSNTYHYHINLSWEYFEGTYEEAELACLNKLIEIVKQPKNN